MFALSKVTRKIKYTIGQLWSQPGKYVWKHIFRAERRKGENNGLVMIFEAWAFHSTNRFSKNPVISHVNCVLQFYITELCIIRILLSNRVRRAHHNRVFSVEWPCTDVQNVIYSRKSKSRTSSNENKTHHTYNHWNVETDITPRNAATAESALNVFNNIVIILFVTKRNLPRRTPAASANAIVNNKTILSITIVIIRVFQSRQTISWDRFKHEIERFGYGKSYTYIYTYAL